MRRTRHLQRLREEASILMCRTAVAALAAALTTGTVVAHADSESYMTCMAMTLGTTTSRSVGPSIRTSTRTVLLPHISVPDGFDNPLPDAEIDAWEGKSRLGLGHLGVRVAALLRHSDKSGLRGARAAEHQAAGRRKRQRHAAARSSDGASASTAVCRQLRRQTGPLLRIRVMHYSTPPAVGDLWSCLTSSFES